MLSRICKSRVSAAVFAATILMTILADAQAQTAQHNSAQHSSQKQMARKIYEDNEIRVAIPAGWRIVQDSAIQGSDAAMSLGNSVSQASGKLLLEKNKYTLGIAYNTGHASGIEGGRFIEIFNIPWPGVDDAWDCSLYLSGFPQPASRILMFTNVVADPTRVGVNEHCGIKIDSRAWGDENGVIRRWFGGYFTTAEGGYFFDSQGEGCGQKAYTFTFQEKRPDRLPNFNDSTLKKMIQEAIDVVDSIQYKRCAPI